MEKPSWAFVNKTYLNNFKNADGTNTIIFSDFEHNWDLFQFLTNDNKYYFNLNHNINSEYNFKIIYSTIIQKCKHLSLDNISLIIKSFDLLIIVYYKYISDFLKLQNYIRFFNLHILTFYNL